MKVDIKKVKLIYKPLEELNIIQGDLKALSDENYKKLKKEILGEGFKIPFFVWLDKEGKKKVIDGTQRLITLNRMKSEGIDTTGNYPICTIEARNEKDALKTILAISSQFGTITTDSIIKFSEENNIELKEIDERFVFDNSQILINDIDEKKETKDKSDSLEDVYELVLSFSNENELEKAFVKFSEEGYKCRTLIL